MKKMIVLIVLTVCMVMSGYTFAKYKLSAAENRNEVSDSPSNNSGQAIASNSNSNTSPQTSAGAANTAAVSKGSSVVVDISDQRVYVYYDSKISKTFVCSTGIEDENYKTPRGNYIINESGAKKGEWFYSNKYQEGAKYWVGFIGGTYLFHSVPMDINKNIIEEEADKLGTPASHGCIRLSVDDAYWFYKNIKSGTKLIVQD